MVQLVERFIFLSKPIIKIVIQLAFIKMQRNAIVVVVVVVVYVPTSSMG